MSLIYGDYAVDPSTEEIRRNWGVIIEGDIIVDSGEKDILVEKYPSYEKLSAKRSVLMPSLINSHTHLSMVLLRGVSEQRNQSEWFKEVVYPREKLLDSSDVYTGAKMALTELAFSGAASFVDMYFYEDSVLKAGLEVGLRGVYAYGMVDNGDPNKAEREVTETNSFIRQANSTGSSLVRAAIAPHTLYTCSPALLRRVSSLSEETGLQVHMHLAERPDEKHLIRDKFKVNLKGFHDYLREFGLLNEKLVCFHCTHLSIQELDALKAANSLVVLNPTSNLRLGNGLPPVNKVKSVGLNFGVGTDGAASNDDLFLLNEAKMLMLASMITDGPRLTSWEALKALTLPSEKLFGTKPGLKKGCSADVTLYQLGIGNNLSHHITRNLVYSPKGISCCQLVVSGRTIIRDGQMVAFDTDKLLDEYTIAVERIENKVGERS
jgi:5-methylthioadenosine/S-adenosylhomocysteine deaminase